MQNKNCTELVCHRKLPNANSYLVCIIYNFGQASFALYTFVNFLKVYVKMVVNALILKKKETIFFLKQKINDN